MTTDRINESQPPQWLEDLLEVISNSFRPDVPCGPLGFIWSLPTSSNNKWHVNIFPTTGEIAEAGPEDGMELVPGFQLLLNPITRAFDEVPKLVWLSPSNYRGELDGPGVAYQGKVKGNDIVLCIFEEPPSIFKPTVIFDRLKGETRCKESKSDDCAEPPRP
jgi:hypothetical protein